MNWLYSVGKLLSHCVFDGGFPGDAAGVEHIPRKGPFILAANHTSFFDPPAIGRLVPREICYFARKSLFKTGLIGSILSSVHAIPVDREGVADIQAVKRVLHALRQGRGVLFFPEGTRSFDGNLCEPEPGIGMIACKSRVPVIPVRIYGSYKAYGRNMKVPDLNVPVSVAFGPPLSPDDFDPGRSAESRYQEASRRIMDAIAAIPPPPPP